jgi:hypothetical protein
MNFLISFFNLFKILKNNKITYIFYSEGHVYQNNFYDFIIGLSRNIQDDIYYVSSNNKDIINNKKIINFYIGKGLARIFFFYYIKSKFFFLTLTDLDNYHLKKSKRVFKYVYIFHSPISLSKSYTPKAFNNYDILFSIGKKQTEEFEKIFQNKKTLKNKEIVRTGYFYFDYLKKNIDTNKLQKNTVLVAPSWNYNKVNFLSTACQNLIKHLIDNDFKVIFRPHPENFKRDHFFLERIKKIFLNNRNFFFDKNFSNVDSINKSELLITDNSGIAIEFCLIAKRPIFYFESSEKLHNPDSHFIKDITLEEMVKNKFGKLIRIEDMFLIKSFLDKQKNYFNQELLHEIDDFTNKYFYNLNNSTKVAISYILNYKI